MRRTNDHEEKVASRGRRIKGSRRAESSFGPAHGGMRARDSEGDRRSSKQNPERKIRVRIGLNTGEVVEEAGDIFGAAVNVAARVAGKARGGEILVSDVVRQLVGPMADMKFEPRAGYQPQALPDTLRLHRVTPGEVKESARALPTGDGFVDREQERLDIRMMLERAATGSGGMLFLTGSLA